MIKKLDILVVRAFVGPFAATFFITLLVLILQFFWLWIDDFVGKGLSTTIILKFIWYQSAALVPLALPLAILLSSLMTFGRLGESFELVAIKSAGISLVRFMRPLFFVTLLVCGVAFMFSNYIIPVVNLKSRTMLGDIVRAQPAFDLKEGVFYDKLRGVAIKIGKKEANDSVIKDVIVYEQDQSLQDNFVTAKSGVMRVSPNRRFLEFTLQDGWRYQERADKYNAFRTNYIRFGFKEYKTQFDLSSLQVNWTNDSVNANNEKAYSMRQLDNAIDSMKKQVQQMKHILETNVYGILSFTKFLDSPAYRKFTPATDTSHRVLAARAFDDLLPDSVKQSVHDRTLNQVNSLQASLGASISNLKEMEKNLRKHKVEWHRKIVLSLACLVLFLIGAPLGSIIRKGGLGTPLIFAILFFMVFYFSTTVGEKFVGQDKLTPFAGMWLSTFVLVPVGIFLTVKAMKDSQLFNKEWYVRMIRPIRGYVYQVLTSLHLKKG